MDWAVQIHKESHNKEKDFLSRLREQDESAFLELVKMESSRMYSICLQYFGDPSTAEDVVQEVFIKIFESIGSFHENCKLTTWIYRITVNACIEEIRKRKSKKRSFFFQSFAHSEKEQEHWKDTITTNDMADKQLETEAHRSALYQAVRQLPEDQQQAFVLCYMEEMSGREVAEIMDKTESAVEGLLHRAKSKMKRLLYDYYQNNIKK